MLSLAAILFFAVIGTTLLSFSSAAPNTPNDPNYPLADTNNDNRVDIFDLSYLLAQWGRVDSPGGSGGVTATNYLTFDGSDDYISLNNLDIPGSALTLEAMVDLDSIDNCAAYDCRIISKTTSTAEQDHYFMLSTTRSGNDAVLRFRVKAGGTTTTVVATTGALAANIETRDTHHVAGTYDGSTMRLYLDGVEVGTAAKTGTIDQNPGIDTWIGSNPTTPSSRPWHGSIDDVRIWNVARTQAELQAAKDTELTGSEAGLLHYYKFNENAGQTIADSAGANNTVLGSTAATDTNDPGIIINIPDITSPTPPSNLVTANPTGNTLDLSWSAATDDIGVARYLIYRDAAQVATVIAPTTTFTDTELTPLTTYTYTVYAEDAASNTSLASGPIQGTTDVPDTTPPSTPTGVGATAASSSTIDVSWNAATDNIGVTAYVVSRGGTDIATILHPATSYTDSSLSSETNYVYTVRSTDAAGNHSPQSGSVNATTLDGAGSWEEAVDSQNMETIRSWYLENTGFKAPACGNLTEADLVPWTASRDITTPGTYVGYKITGPIKIKADNVTIQCSELDVNGSYSYAVTATEADNWTIENVSLTNSVYEASQNHEDKGNRPVYTTRPGTFRANQVLDGFTTGFAIHGSGAVFEYNFNDHIVRSPGSHNTSGYIRSQGSPVSNISIYRNLLADGTSSAFSFYTRAAGLHENISIKENVFDLYYTSSTNYCVNYDKKHPAYPNYTLSNVEYVGNIFGQSAYPACGSSGPVSGGCNQPGTCVKMGERFLDGTPIN